MRLSTEQAISLLEGFDVEACEKAVSFGNKFCGTYDMYGECDGEKVLIDIKTTSEFDEEYLQWQLGMYKLAMEEHGDQVDKCMCLWLPKGKIASLKDVVPKTRYDIEWLLYRYEEEFAFNRIGLCDSHAGSGTVDQLEHHIYHQWRVWRS